MQNTNTWKKHKILHALSPKQLYHKFDPQKATNMSRVRQESGLNLNGWASPWAAWWLLSCSRLVTDNSYRPLTCPSISCGISSKVKQSTMIRQQHLIQLPLFQNLLHRTQCNPSSDSGSQLSTSTQKTINSWPLIITMWNLQTLKLKLPAILSACQSQ